ncbi:hypothetical protein ACFQJC_03215 [Haloferax namakaokahaiae]|uniref:Uncharacterized protein n=1 Tax=Haloferax namakaokahaiae TaxID=1748331 RepID=A0ABD5ZB52_9EURY
MDRRFLIVIGAFDLLIVAGATILGLSSSLPQLVWLASFALAGLLFVVAGVRESVTVGSRRVRWNVFAGLGYVFFGVGMLANTLPMLGGDRQELFLGGFMLVTLVPVMLFLGIDYLRGGVHFDISKLE